MPDIMVLFACLHHCLAPTPLRQLARVIEAMLSMSGRVTMRGLSIALVWQRRQLPHDPTLLHDESERVSPAMAPDSPACARRG